MILLIYSELCTLKTDFFEDIFQRALWIDFRIANYLKSEYSQEYAWRILFIDFKTTTTTKNHLKVH